MIRRPPRSTLFPSRRSSDLMSSKAWIMRWVPSRSVLRRGAGKAANASFSAGDAAILFIGSRSEERRVGKEWRSWWWPWRAHVTVLVEIVSVADVGTTVLLIG